MTNKSKSYILPLFNNYVDIKYIGLVYNTYLFMEGEENNYLIIQYNNENLDDFQQYIDKLSEYDLVSKIDRSDEYIYVFLEVPEELQNDYDSFVSGRFSNISRKNDIINFLTKNYGAVHFKIINRIKQVLYKDRALKEEIEYDLDITLPESSELSSIPEKVTETLKL